MKYSYLWLKELSKTRKTPAQLAELLTMRAFEFEGLKTEGKETQMEFSILPHRGHDALSHIGLAREICVCEGRKFPQKELRTNDIYVNDRQDGCRLDISIEDKKLCRRYIGVVIENVKVGLSPKWMQKRLLVCGIKPINNIVDITNYVMLETGQPLHAFDLMKVGSESPISSFQFPNKFQTSNPKIRINIRRAGKGERIKLLDEKFYNLSENDLIIADSEKPIALAGIMGGFDSSITEETRNVILEAANFNSTNIRKTSRRHNIITESSYRFEREIDPNLAEIGALRAVELMKQYGGRNVQVAALSDIYSQKTKPWRIRLNINYVDSLLGEKVPISKMRNILENLGLKIKIAKNILNCEIPTYRIDLKTREDLIEEIGRIYGYENIKEQPLKTELSEVKENKKRNFENRIRDILTGLGFSEVMNYSFYGADDIAKCNLKIEDHVEVANPLSRDQQYLRWSLVPNILKNINLNLKNYPCLEIFEVGNKFYKQKGDLKEVTVLVGAMAGEFKKNNLFYELKGKLEALLNKLGYEGASYQSLNTDYQFWHQTRTAKIILDKEEIGRIGEINPQVLKKHGVGKRAAVFEIEISDWLKTEVPPKTYLPVSKFPVVERDISMFIQGDTKYSEIIKEINEVGKDLVKSVELFDVFEREGKKSLALRLKIGSNTKTLTSSEIEAVMRKIISKLEENLKVKIRK